MWTVRIEPEDREGANYPIVEALQADEAAQKNRHKEARDRKRLDDGYHCL
jgi:hypothetical protein